jgi:hypothetical protein
MFLLLDKHTSLLLEQCLLALDGDGRLSAANAKLFQPCLGCGWKFACVPIGGGGRVFSGAARYEHPVAFPGAMAKGEVDERQTLLFGIARVFQLKLARDGVELPVQVTQLLCRLIYKVASLQSICESFDTGFESP